MWERGTLCQQNPNGILGNKRQCEVADVGKAAKARKVTFAQSNASRKRKSKKPDDSTGQQRQKVARKTGNSAGADSAGGQQLVAIEESAPAPPPFFHEGPSPCSAGSVLLQVQAEGGSPKPQ